MSKKRSFVFVLLFVVILFFYYIFAFNLKGGGEVWPTPDWVKEIESKVDSDKCSPYNCSACDANTCSEDTCKIISQRYSCGFSCDAVIEYCTNK